MDTTQRRQGATVNAQAVINAERPWIFIEESESAKAADHRQAYVRIMGRNKGRTPAEITVVSCVFGWFPYGHEYPDEPEYPPVELKYKKYVSSDESFEIYDFNCATSVLDGMWEEFGARRERLTFTGRVIYRDVITAEEHETRFCYFLSPHGGIGLIMVGPTNYNKHT